MEELNGSFGANKKAPKSDQLNILKLRRMIVDSQDEEAEILDVTQQLGVVMKFSDEIADETNQVIENSESLTSRRYFSLLNNEDVTIEYGPEIELAEAFVSSKTKVKHGLSKAQEKFNLEVMLSEVENDIQLRVATPEAFTNIKTECQRLQDFIGNMLEEHHAESDNGMVKLLSVGSSVAQSILTAQSKKKDIVDKLPKKTMKSANTTADNTDESNPPNSMTSFLIGNVVQYKKELNDQKVLHQLEKTLQLVEKMQDQIPSRENSFASRPMTLTSTPSEIDLFPPNPLNQLSAIQETPEMEMGYVDATNTDNYYDNDNDSITTENNRMVRTADTWPEEFIQPESSTAIPPLNQSPQLPPLVTKYNAEDYFEKNKPSQHRNTAKPTNLSTLILQQGKPGYKITANNLQELSFYGPDYGLATGSVLLSNEKEVTGLMKGSVLEEMDSGKITRNNLVGSVGSNSGQYTAGMTPSTATSSLPTRSSISYGSRQSVRSYFDTSITPRKPIAAKDLTSPYLTGTQSLMSTINGGDSLVSSINQENSQNELSTGYSDELFEPFMAPQPSTTTPIAPRMNSITPVRPPEPQKSPTLLSPNKRNTINFFKG